MSSNPTTDETQSVMIGTQDTFELEPFIPTAALTMAQEDDQKAIPAIARNSELASSISQRLRQIPTWHKLWLGDSRSLDRIADNSVHLVLTSPPYWTLKSYPTQSGQLGAIDNYEVFVEELAKVWAEALRVLVPGGRLVIVVGDVCLARRQFGRHVVFPLHASIQESCRRLGFDNLAPIIWHKIANAQFESPNRGGFLGKPYEPNAIIKNDIEFVLFERKPGGYRQPSLAARVMSVIPEESHRAWFRQIWTMPGASTRQHPAPFPLELAQRVVRMFSFVGDTVLDPFLGTGTTSIAAGGWGRNSIGLEIEPSYLRMASAGVKNAAGWQTQLAIKG